MVSPSDLRSAFQKRLNQDNPPIQFHPSDLERIKDDRYLLRVLEHCKNDLELASKLLWHIMKWRKNVGASDINEGNIRMDYANEGTIFPHGRDMDGCRLVVLKCKNYIKGKKDFEEVKRGIIYFLDRIEREEDGNKVTLFFDLDGCGLQNMDVELIKFLITVLTYYYPLFLNRIIVFQLPWMLTAGFKLVKSFLRPEAVELLVFANKSNLKEYVHPDQALVCWGGNNDYVFKFVPEKPKLIKKVSFASTPLEDKLEKFQSESTCNFKATEESKDPTINTNNNSQNSSISSNANSEEILLIEPRERLTFKNENEKLIARIKITNLVENVVVFKVKTTSPQKFWVRPTSAYIEPKQHEIVLITVLPGHQKTVSKDKFMIVATEVRNKNLDEINKKELENLWNENDKIDQYRLRCHFNENSNKNNNNLSNFKNVSVKNTINNNLEEKIDAARVTLRRVKEDIKDLKREMSFLKYLQLVNISLVLLLTILGYYCILYRNFDKDL